MIHLLRAAASGESLAAAGVDRWLRMAEASNAAGTRLESVAAAAEQGPLRSPLAPEEVALEFGLK